MIKSPFKTTLLLLIFATFFSQAKTYIYQGKVEGMVCAFCTYNVGKKIATFPGV